MKACRHPQTDLTGAIVRALWVCCGAGLLSIVLLSMAPQTVARAQLISPGQAPAGTRPTPTPEAASFEPPPSSTPTVETPDEAAGELTEPEPGHARRRGPARPEGAPEPEAQDDPAGADPEEPWRGPRVQLGYSRYVLSDGFGGGDVNAGVFGGWLPTGPIRLGAAAELGGRAYALAQSDAVVRFSAQVGFQHLSWRPLVPYAVLVASFGVVLAKRFHTPLTQTFGGAGLEVGADLNLVRSLFVGLGLAYLRVSHQAAGHDLWVLRLRIGL